MLLLFFVWQTIVLPSPMRTKLFNLLFSYVSQTGWLSLLVFLIPSGQNEKTWFISQMHWRIYTWTPFWRWSSLIIEFNWIPEFYPSFLRYLNNELSPLVMLSYFRLSLIIMTNLTVSVPEMIGNLFLASNEKILRKQCS